MALCTTTHKGKVYRIIVEEINVGHPCEAIVVIFEISNSKDPKEVHREAATDDRELDRLTQGAKVLVKNI
jgi:hypothetical protein